MSATAIKRRPFFSWLRAYITDMVKIGTLPPSKAPRTARVVHMLLAKARRNFDGNLTARDFEACTRVIAEPSIYMLDLEAEIAWSLFDQSRMGTIGEQDSVELRSLLAELGCEIGEDTPLQTFDEYLTWNSSSGSQMRSTKTSRLQTPASRAATAPSEDGRRGRMIFTKELAAADQSLRSRECCDLSLLAHMKQQLPRTLTPSRLGKVKRPGKSLRMSEEEALAESRQQMTPWPATTPRLAPVRKPLDWEAQNDNWLRRENRLRPFMQVKAKYVRNDGTKAEGSGVLLSGWGISNKAASIPHASPPEGARLGDARKALEETPGALVSSPLSSSGRPASGISSEDASPTWPNQLSGKLWAEEVRRWKDTENHVIVMINGAEKLVPRERVTPLVRKRSSASPRDSPRNNTVRSLATTV